MPILNLINWIHDTIFYLLRSDIYGLIPGGYTALLEFFRNQPPLFSSFLTLGCCCTFPLILIIFGATSLFGARRGTLPAGGIRPDGQR